MGNQFLLVAMVVILAFFFFMSWRNNRKRQRDEAEKSSKLVKGVEVMTSSGLFGTVESVDLENNKVVLETSPGNFITVHRQSIGRIETPAADEPVVPAEGDAASNIDAANEQARAAAENTSGEPAYGERTTPDKNDD
jgi:preprotein translocase subunit YajC